MKKTWWNEPMSRKNWAWLYVFGTIIGAVMTAYMLYADRLYDAVFGKSDDNKKIEKDSKNE